MPFLDFLLGPRKSKEKKQPKARKPKPSLPSFGRYRKQKIPAALRQQVWIQRAGRIFEHKCSTTWCSNIITVFDFECGHNVPESKGGKTSFENLIPICRSCNMSMSNSFTFDEWCIKHSQSPSVQTPSIETPRPRGQPRKNSAQVSQAQLGNWCVPMFHPRILPQT